MTGLLDWKIGNNPGFLWVSEDRCLLVRCWVVPEEKDVPLNQQRGFGLHMEPARRDHPSHIWKPPITLTEEKT